MSRNTLLAAAPVVVVPEDSTTKRACPLDLDLVFPAVSLMDFDSKKNSDLDRE
jgi:hypothetical protein